MSLKNEISKALKEIGEINPWWSEDDRMYVFEHPLYPFVMHADPDLEKTRKGYLRALSGFIEERMRGNVAESVDRITEGRGGFRFGAGHPKETKKELKLRIYLPVDIVNWLRSDPTHLEEVRRLING